MSSRIAHHIDFPDYSADELEQIGALMLEREGYLLAAEAVGTFRSYVERRMTQPRFAIARSIRNAIERARLRQASRLLLAGAACSREDLQRLEPSDLLASRVLGRRGGPPGPEWLTEAAGGVSPGACAGTGPARKAVDHWSSPGSVGAARPRRRWAWCPVPAGPPRWGPAG